MKNTVLWSLVACLLILVSCVKEEDRSPAFRVDGLISFEVVNADNDETRTVRDGNSVLWSPGDNIHVFYGALSSKFTSTNTAAAATATFNGSLEGIEYNNNTKFWALYPYSDTDSFDGNYLTFTLPQKQDAVAGTFDRDLFPAVARSSGLELSFRNVCGGVKFCVDKAGVTKVTFKGNLSEPLAGTVKVGLKQDGIPYVSDNLQSKSEITLSAPAGSTLEKGKWYHMVTLPASLSKGYTMTLVFEDNHREIIKYDNVVEIKRSVFGKLTNVNTMVTEMQNPAGGTQSGLYLGITGFNKALYYYPIGLLNESSLDDFHSFIDGLGQEHMTLLYYSVKDAIRTLQIANYPADLFSASIVTFTDGEDDGSVYYERYPGDDEDYLNDVNALLNEEEVAGLPLNAWTVGLQSADASNSQLFLQHLQKLSRPAKNGVRVTNMSQVNSAFENIAKELNQSFNVYNVSIRMVGKSNGTKVRFTLDNVFAADNSTKYVEGYFDMYNACLYDVTYHGFTCDSGYRVQGTESGGLITFRFEGIRTTDDTEIKKEWFKQWGWNKTTNSWHPYSEFDPGQDSSVERIQKSAVVLLNLDCTTSLSSGSTDLFPQLKSYAKTFVTRLWEYTLDSQTAVYSVSLDKKTLDLEVGGTATLTATVRPSTATNKSVTWSSSNTSVATVSSSGKVTAQKAGAAIISATSVDGGKSAQCMVVVGAVDLGLSVKWAPCNVGASNPEDFGDYFAWGETQPKSDYSWSTYKWCNGSSNTLTKYNTKSSYGTVDNKTVLDISDDAARENWGGSWRMPTDAELTELRTKCSWIWTTQGGKNGYKVKGPNGNSIFLPAAGYRDGTNILVAGFYGYYSSINTDKSADYARVARFDSGNVYRSSSYRYYGFSVRPVYGDFVSVSKVTLDKTSISMMEGGTETLVATITPSNATVETVTWTSSNTSVATVSSSGTITAVSAGMATITAWASDGEHSATCTVTVNYRARYVVFLCTDMTIQLTSHVTYSASLYEGIQINDDRGNKILSNGEWMIGNGYNGVPSGVSAYDYYGASITSFEYDTRSMPTEVRQLLSFDVDNLLFVFDYSQTDKRIEGTYVIPVMAIIKTRLGSYVCEFRLTIKGE